MAQDMERRLRQRNMDALTAIIKDLGLNVGTRWRAAHEVILAAPAFRNDTQLQKIETLDILTVWDNYSRQIEQEHETESKRLRIDRVRKGRKAREAFEALLHELRRDGVLTRQSKWKDLYPRIKKDERYENLLGMQGSSPLDLWMDAVDDMQVDVERAAEKVQQALRRGEKVLTADTKVDEFEGWVKEVDMENKLKNDVFAFVSSFILVAFSRIMTHRPSFTMSWRKKRRMKRDVPSARGGIGWMISATRCAKYRASTLR